MASVLDLVKHYQHAIEKYPQDEQKILKCIDKLYQLGVTVQHLQETGVGRTVNALRKEPGDVGQAARALVCKWKLMVASEESDQEGDHNNETSKYNGNGKDSDDSVNQSRPEYSRQENETSYESSSKSDQNDYKHMNGNHSGSKRKYPSSEDEESNAKKSRHSSSSEEDYHRKTGVKIRKESSDSESDNQDTENSQSDSDASDTSEEETKINIKSEPVDKHHKSSSSKHSSYNNVDHNKKSSTSKKTSDSSDSKHSKHRSESKHSTESLSKERSHSSHKHKSSKEKEDTSDKRHKLEKESNQKEELSSPSKHKSNSEKHRSSSQKPDSGSEKHKSHNKSDKHGGKSEKHVSSSHKHKLENDRHKKPSEKETASDKHKSKDNSSSLKEKHSSSKEKSKDRSSSKEKGKEKSSDRHNIGDKKHSLHKEKSKDSDKKSKHEKNNENDEKTSKTTSSSSHKSSSSNTSKEPKKKHVNSIEDGIDCGSGASFAEALGMITPNKPKKKSSGMQQQSPSNSFTNDLSPAALLAPTAKLAPLPALEISALPEISPNYKPRPPPKLMPHFSDEDAISVVMSSKNQRTKVYSGNKVLGKIPSLYEMCVQILQEHIDALEFTGGVPYEILKPVVDKATPQQLFVLEHFNPYLMEDTDHLWQKFCEKHFRNKQRQELESWREMYIRCQEEQEHKLKSLTANIKIAQEAKKAPIKQTKMAYVDSAVKPPRNIARKQAQHGTAHVAAASPAARVAALASAPNVHRGSGRPSPVIPTTTIQKPKKAPLMQKALQFMRGRKR